MLGEGSIWLLERFVLRLASGEALATEFRRVWALERRPSRVVMAAQAEQCYRFKRVEAYEGGIGAFATRFIAKGEVILREAPICTSTLETLDRVEAALSESARKQLYSLCDWRATATGSAKTALGVFQANGYPAPSRRGSDEAGVFLRFSRLNHSCAPNVSHKWYDFREKVVFASRDIEAGEELLNNYVELCAPGGERRKLLSERFGFDCRCVACAAADEAPSDARRAKLAALDESVFKLCRRGRYDQAARDAETRLALLAEEGLDAPAALVRTCHDAYQAMDHAGDVDGARLWLQRVLDNSLLCEPPESPELEELRGRLARLDGA